MWVCSKCGAFNSDENESCTSCGESREADQSSSKKGQPLAPNKGKKSKNKNNKKNKKGKLLLITAILMVVIAVAAVAISIAGLDHHLDLEGTPEVAETIEIEAEEEEAAIISEHETLRMATFMNAEDTGIMEMLSEEFYAETGIVLEYISVGVDEALSAGREGDVDLVFVNAPVSEDLFVEEGYGVERIVVMHNDFVVVGPGDLAEPVEDVGLLFTVIEMMQLPFLSLGDNSGAHQMEMAIWMSFDLGPTDPIDPAEPLDPMHPDDLDGDPMYPDPTDPADLTYPMDEQMDLAYPADDWIDPDDLTYPIDDSADSVDPSDLTDPTVIADPVDPAANPNYRVSGEGMSDTLLMANEERAITLTDRATWLVHSRDSGMELIILCEGDPMLFNPYSIIAVSPARHPQVNHEGANAFIDWILSERAQGLIREFGTAQFGEPLFVPGVGMIE